MSVEFDPVPLGPRRRRVDPGAVVAVAALVFVALAVVKPWEGEPAGPDAAAASSSPAASSATAPAGRTTSPTRAPTGRLWPPALADPLIDPDELSAVLQRRERWGVRTLIDAERETSRRSLVERWLAVEPSQPDGSIPDPAEPVVLQPGGRRIRAIGITAPPSETPLDVRVSALLPGTAARLLDVRPVEATRSAGHLLLLPPRLADGIPEAWPAGRYRFDLLGSGGIRRLDVEVPGGRGAVELTLSAIGQPPGPLVVDPFNVDLRGMPPGPFLVLDGVPVPIGVRSSERLDVADAWLDAQPGSRSVGVVAEVWAPRTNGLGLVLPPGVRADAFLFGRLAPAPLDDGGSSRIHRSVGVAGDSEAAIFRGPGGSAWPPGTYVLEAVWQEAGELRTSAWHVTLMAGPSRRRTEWLGSLRAWARHAGDWGFVSGTAEPLEGGPSGVAIRLHAQQPDAAPVAPEVLGDRCHEAALVDAGRPLLGIAHPDDSPVLRIRAERLFVRGRSVPEPVVTVPDALPGLSLVAPPVGEAWQPGYYRFVVERDADHAGLVVCIGEARRAFSRVPPEAASDGAYRLALDRAFNP